MVTFSVYTYLFSPVTEAEGVTFFPDEADLRSRYEMRHKALDEFFEGKENLFHIETARQAYSCKMLLERDGVIVMRLANNKKKRREYHFEMLDDPDEPSCLLVLDNRPRGGQTVCIERRPAFGTPQVAATILEEALNKFLLKFRLRVGVNAKYSTQSFWQTVDKHPAGIVKVNFSFPYPNMPEISDRIRHFEEIARETNSEPELILKGQHRENLLLSPDNLFIIRAIEACAASGKPILITPRAGRQAQVNVLKQVSEEAPDALFEDLNRPDLFDSKFTLILEFLKNIKLVYDA